MIERTFRSADGEETIWLFSHDDTAVHLCTVVPEILMGKQFTKLSENLSLRPDVNLAVMHGGVTGNALGAGGKVDADWSSGTVFIVCSSQSLSNKQPRVVMNVNNIETGVAFFIQKSANAASFHKDDWEYIIEFVRKNRSRLIDLVRNLELLKKEEHRGLLIQADNSIESVMAYYLLLVALDKNVLDRASAKRFEEKFGEKFWGDIQTELTFRRDGFKLPSSWEDFLSDLAFWASTKKELTAFLSKADGL
jgi:hypothetical protein